MKAFESKLMRLGEQFHPVTCHWELTRRCNAQCDYCLIREPSPRDLPTKTMLQIAEKIISEGILYAVVSGGEPFIRKDVLQILDLLFDSDLFWVSILTNGTLVSRKEIDALSKHADRINMVQMSVFSHKEEVNDSYFKVPGALRKILWVAKALKDAGVHVVIAHNVFNFNAGDAKETKKYFTDLGLTLRPAYQKHAPASNKSCIQSERVCSDYQEGFLEAIDKEMLQGYIRRMQENTPPDFAHRFPCNAARSFVSVDYQGVLWPCTALQDTALGSVLSGKSFHQMLRESEIAQRIHRLRNKDFEKCTKCEYFGFCNQCLALNYAQSGSYTVPADETCRFAQTVKKIASSSNDEQTR